MAVKLNQASTGRISGISYARAPEPARDGSDADPIWFKGSQLGKAYGWNQVGDQLRDTIPERGQQPQPQPTAGPPPGAAQQRGDSGGELPQPPALERSLELKTPNLDERRAHALETARERAAQRARQHERQREQDRER